MITAAERRAKIDKLRRDREAKEKERQERQEREQMMPQSPGLLVAGIVASACDVAAGAGPRDWGFLGRGTVASTCTRGEAVPMW